MKIQQLTIPEGKILLEQLQRESDFRTLPVRGFLHTILSGRVGRGKIFVEQWPVAAHIACVTDGKEIFKHLDWDYSNIYSRDSKRPDFQEFLEALLRERHWETRPIFMGGTLDDQKLDLQRGLVKNPNGLQNFGPWVAVVGDSRREEEERNLPPQIAVSFSLPEGLTLDTLKPADAGLVKRFWGYDMFPEQLQYFVWTINNLPQACIRDSNGQPVAWGLEYPMGSGAARFTLREYRGRGLSLVLDTHRLKIHYEGSDVPFHAGISPDNARSFHVSESGGMKRTETLYSTFIYDPLAPGKHKL